MVSIDNDGCGEKGDIGEAMEGGKGGRGVCVLGRGWGLFQDGMGWREDGGLFASTS